MVASLAEAQSPNVSPETFLAHFRAIRDATRTKDDAVMGVARCKKAAKRDGLDLDALKLLENLAKLDDDELAVQLRHLHQYAKWASLPLGTQLDAFGEHVIPTVKAKAVGEHDLWTATDVGYKAGRSGLPRDTNPYQPGTELHVNFDKAWTDGQRVIADEMHPEKANGAANGTGKPAAKPKLEPEVRKARRGRPPGSKNRTAHPSP